VGVVVALTGTNNKFWPRPPAPGDASGKLQAEITQTKVRKTMNIFRRILFHQVKRSES
jgi:hypothetical protein